jgi:hypothetical protein
LIYDNAPIINKSTFLKLWYQHHHVIMTNVTAIPTIPNDNVLSFAEIIDSLFLDAEVSVDVAPSTPPEAPVNVPGSQ